MVTLHLLCCYCKLWVIDDKAVGHINDSWLSVTCFVAIYTPYLYFHLILYIYIYIYYLIMQDDVKFSINNGSNFRGRIAWGLEKATISWNCRRKLKHIKSLGLAIEQWNFWWSPWEGLLCFLNYLLVFQPSNAKINMWLSNVTFLFLYKFQLAILTRRILNMCIRLRCPTQQFYYYCHAWETCWSRIFTKGIVIIQQG